MSFIILISISLLSFSLYPSLSLPPSLSISLSPYPPLTSPTYFRHLFHYYRFDPKSGLLGMSHAQFPSDQLGPGGDLFLSVVSKLGLAKVERGLGDKKNEIRVNNLTIINFVLKFIGPTHERTLTIYMMIIQVNNTSMIIQVNNTSIT